MYMKVFIQISFKSPKFVLNLFEFEACIEWHPIFRERGSGRHDTESGHWNDWTRLKIFEITPSL